MMDSLEIIASCDLEFGYTPNEYIVPMEFRVHFFLA